MEITKSRPHFYAFIQCFYVGAIPLVDSLFAESIKPTVITSLKCQGNETVLVNCQINNELVSSCGQFEDAGIVCQGTVNFI